MQIRARNFLLIQLDQNVLLQRLSDQKLLLALRAVAPENVLGLCQRRNLVYRRSATRARTAHFAARANGSSCRNRRCVVDEKLVLRNEPLRRGAGKPHIVEQLYRVAAKRFTFVANIRMESREREYR